MTGSITSLVTRDCEARLGVRQRPRSTGAPPELTRSDGRIECSVAKELARQLDFHFPDSVDVRGGLAAVGTPGDGDHRARALTRR